MLFVPDLFSEGLRLSSHGIIQGGHTNMFKTAGLILYIGSIDDPDKFTIELVHNGFFCGLKDNLCYESGSVDFFDNCSTDTFSLVWVEDFLRQVGHEMTSRTSIYWCLPGKDLIDGLCCIETDSHILAMTAAVKDDKNLCLMVDHTSFLKGLREEVIVQDGATTTTTTSARGRNKGDSYRTGPGSTYHLLFGDDRRRTELPDLNEMIPHDDAEVIHVTQNEPE